MTLTKKITFKNNKLSLLIPLVLLLLAIPLSILLTQQRQEIRKKASGTGASGISLSLYPTDETFNKNETKVFTLTATFADGVVDEKLDYFKTVVTFDKNYLQIPVDKYIDTSSSGFDTIFKVDGPTAANQTGQITIELGASTPGAGPATDKPITIAKIYFRAILPVSSAQSVTLGNAQIVNNSKGNISLLTAQGFSYTINPTSSANCMDLPKFDTFDANAAFNNNFWSSWLSNNGVTVQAGGVLETTLSSGNGYAGVITQSNVCGDFDVNVDFNQFTTSGQSEADARLSIEDQTTNSTVFIERFNQGNTQGFHAIKVINGTETQFGSPVTSGSTMGKMRIRRIGSTYTVYYDVGNGWQAFDPANAFSSDAKVALIVKSWSQNPSVSANFDNFNLTPAIADPSVTPIPTNTPIPSITLSPTPASGRDQYLIDVGDKQSLVFTINPGINSQIKFKVKLASLRSYPELYLRLRVKDELAFTSNPSSTISTDTCNNPTAPDRDFYIPVRANGDTYSPVQQISPPVPPGVTVASVTADGWVILDGMVPGRYYTFYLKGPKTRRSRMVQHVNLQPTKDSSQDFDWTGKPLDPGDLADPNNGGKQDCTINSTDWSLEKARIGSTDGASLDICDVNYDGLCNSGDSVAILDTLSKRPDDDQ